MLFVFMSQPDFACNPYALYRYISDYTEHEVAWIIKKSERYYELIKRNIRCALYNTLAGNQLVDEADYVISNTYTFLRIPKRENQIFVNLWHGSGIKAHDFYNHDMDLKHVKIVRDFFDKIDLMCVHSLDDRFKLAAMENYDLRKCFVTGQPRLDCVRSSDGYGKLKKILGKEMNRYKRFIFFAPSFRANSCSHSGTLYSENIFRVRDYDERAFHDFLEENEVAFIYKLHPAEQTAFSGRQFALGEHCYELTDQLLFENDIRYDELLNVFDVMISDYSSIAFDFLLLDRPIVYLIPDYKEYMSEKGFVFHNVETYMPGEKAFDFSHMLSALETALNHPDTYRKEREFVLSQRFDYKDDQSSRRCFETIMNYRKIPDIKDLYIEETEITSSYYPSTAELIKKWIPEQYEVIDSTKVISEKNRLEIIKKNKHKEYMYITEEIPGELRRLSGQSSTEIKDISFYYDVMKCSNVKICYTSGGVDYAMFSGTRTLTSPEEVSAQSASDVGCPDGEKKENTQKRKRIGYAGIIDSRIYFSMVQCICEVFSDCDIIFAGELFSGRPLWLNGFDNLHYKPTAYEILPEVIRSFDVAILPFFGRHKDTVPKEYFQYLACGKQVVASNMKNLPVTKALYCSASVDEAVKNIKHALACVQDIEIQKSAKKLAIEYDWKIIVEKMIKGDNK